MPDTLPPFASEPLKLAPGLSAADWFATCKNGLTGVIDAMLGALFDSAAERVQQANGPLPSSSVP